jgi:hypothetical protein
VHGSSPRDGTVGGLRLALREIGYLGAGTLPRDEIALRHELVVRGADGPAGEAQLSGQRSGRRQPRAGGEAAGAHGVAKGMLEPGPPTGRRIKVDVEVDAESGPEIGHGIGP